MISKLLMAMVIGITGGTLLVSAYAHEPSAAAPRPKAANITIIEKNQDFPFIGPQTYQPCAVEDCTEA